MVLALSCLILASCQSADRESTSGSGNEAELARDSQTIVALHDQWVQSLNEGSRDSLAGFYAEDAVIIPPADIPQIGLVAIRRWIDQQPADVAVVIETYSHEIVVMGDWAFDRGAYAIHSAPRDPSARAIENGNYLRVWRRELSSWKIARDIWNHMPSLGLSDKLKLEPKAP